MLEFILPAIAVAGIAVVALGGRRVIDADDDRLDLIALIDAPAAWSPATTDEAMSR